MTIQAWLLHIHWFFRDTLHGCIVYHFNHRFAQIMSSFSKWDGYKKYSIIFYTHCDIHSRRSTFTSAQALYRPMHIKVKLINAYFMYISIKNKCNTTDIAVVAVWAFYSMWYIGMYFSVRNTLNVNEFIPKLMCKWAKSSEKEAES